MDKAIRKKRARLKAHSAPKKGGMAAEAKDSKTAYIDTKCMAKPVVWLAKSEVEKEEFTTASPDEVEKEEFATTSPEDDVFL